MDLPLVVKLEATSPHSSKILALAGQSKFSEAPIILVWCHQYIICLILPVQLCLGQLSYGGVTELERQTKLLNPT